MRTSAVSMLSLLERAGYGGAFCRENGTIAARNETAGELLAALARCDRLDVPGQLPYRLRQALGESRNAPAFLDAGGLGCVAAQRFPSGCEDERCSILVLADLSRCRQTHPSTLLRAFGLTPCEAELARGIAAGMSLDEVARARGVEIGTIRGQLKAVFSKTGTRRQPEVVALLARLPLFF